MDEVKRSILKIVAKTARKTALFSPKTMSGLFAYEPKMPEQLIRFQQQNVHLKNVDKDN